MGETDYDAHVYALRGFGLRLDVNADQAVGAWACSNGEADNAAL